MTERRRHIRQRLPGARAGAAGPPPGSAPQHPPIAGPAPGGFTLVELLVVVVVLGVLAGVAVPMFGSASEDSRRATLEQNLAILNTAIELYRTEHNDHYPGTLEGEADWDIFVQQMTLPTEKSGAPGTRYGPYLRTGIPMNPYTGTNSGKVGSNGGNPASLAWRYYPSIGLIAAATDGELPEIETGIEAEVAEPDSGKAKAKK